VAFRRWEEQSSRKRSEVKPFVPSRFPDSLRSVARSQRAPHNFSKKSSLFIKQKEDPTDPLYVHGILRIAVEALRKAKVLRSPPERFNQTFERGACAVKKARSS